MQPQVFALFDASFAQGPTFLVHSLSHEFEEWYLTSGYKRTMPVLHIKVCFQLHPVHLHMWKRLYKAPVSPEGLCEVLMWCHLRLYYLPLQPWWLSLLMLLSSVQTMQLLQTTSENLSLLNHCLRQGGDWTTEDLRGIYYFFLFGKMIVIFVDFTRVCQFGRPSSLPLWKN